MCSATARSGSIDLREIAACVDREYGTGTNPVVTIAARGGGSEATERYSAWNGGTALTTHKLHALRDAIDGKPLYFEVARPLLGFAGDAPSPGQATLVTTRPLRSEDETRRVPRKDVVLVAGGGGAHGKAIAGDSRVNAKRGGFGGYADGWAGVPCPFNEGVCARGTPGRHAGGARGGAGGLEVRSPEFVSAAANGAVASSGDRWVRGGHGGGGHPHGGGGEAKDDGATVSAGGGGGGGSFAWRSTRRTPDHLQTLLSDRPGFQLIVHPDVLQSQVEWQYSDFSADDFDAHEIKALEGRTQVLVTVTDPAADKSDLELDGLILVGGCGLERRRIEPYRLTNLVNLGNSFTTTDDSTLSYRVYDADGKHLVTNETQAAASFVVDSTLDLFFVYSNGAGHRGKMSVFADSGERGSAPSARLCAR